MPTKYREIENEEKENDKTENETILELYNYFENEYYISGILSEEEFSEKAKEFNFDKDKIKKFIEQLF